MAKSIEVPAQYVDNEAAATEFLRGVADGAHGGERDFASWLRRRGVPDERISAMREQHAQPDSEYRVYCQGVNAGRSLQFPNRRNGRI